MPLKLSEFGQLFVNVVNIVNHNHTGGGHCLFFILHGDMSVGNNVAGIAHFMAERNRVSGNESDNRLFMLQIFIEIGADFYKNLQHKKPVIGFVAGNAVPFGHKMGYAGDIITNGHITVQDKKEAMAAAGMIVVDNINDIHKELAKL